MAVKEIRVASVFVLGLGAALIAADAVMAQAAQTASAQIIAADQEDEFVKGAISFKTPGVTLPAVTRQTNPKYTASTLREKIQGDVKLQVIVGVDGRVEKARIKTGLHPDLDVEALKAIESWSFEPGRMNDAPVRVLVEVEMAFRVR
jgi:TonB family protein